MSCLAKIVKILHNKGQNRHFWITFNLLFHVLLCVVNNIRFFWQTLVMAKIGRPIKFVIRLTPEERTRLEGMIHCGIGALNSALKARILLKTDVSENAPGWSDERIAEALETSLSTVLRTRRQFVEEGLDAALSRKKSSWSPPRTFDGEAEAKLIALTCSEPPKGHTHWTLRLLEKRVVELGIVEAASYTTIYRVLKKNEVKPHRKMLGDPVRSQC